MTISTLIHDPSAFRPTAGIPARVGDSGLNGTRFSRDFPVFRPHPLLRGGDAQTLGAIYLPTRAKPYKAVRHTITFHDGDQSVLHDDRPEEWVDGDRIVLLMHGLAGCHQSGYMQRIADKLNQLGLRTFRLDLRGCGAAAGLARLPYHAGLSDDVAEVVQWLASRWPSSPVTAVGFSLSGNMLLKLLGESGAHLPGRLDSGVAVCPPIDLMECCRHIGTPRNRFYDRYFAGALHDLVLRRENLLATRLGFSFREKPRRLYDFDRLYTAPMAGYPTVDDYYFRASAVRTTQRIACPTLLLASSDDPLIPSAVFARAPLSDMVDLHLAPSGGHLGFVARSSTVDPDRRWMDWRVVQWIAAADRALRPSERPHRRPAR